MKYLTEMPLRIPRVLRKLALQCCYSSPLSIERTRANNPLRKRTREGEKKTKAQLANNLRLCERKLTRGYDILICRQSAIKKAPRSLISLVRENKEHILSRPSAVILMLSQ